MTAEPFFSVVVPTYNRVNKLLDTIRTILLQTFPDFELIIVDDGSNDGTPEILRREYKDRRLVILSQPNSERGCARNNGFKNAHGKYVVFCDSDDIMHEDHLAVLHDNINSENSPAFIATKFDFIDETGRKYSSDMKTLQQGYYDYKLFLNGNPLACNVAVKRDTNPLLLFEEDRKYAVKEDWLFLISNLQNHKLFIADKVTVTMLDHENRSMRSGNDLIIAKTKLAMQWILEKISLNENEKKKLKAHVNYFCGIHAYLEQQRGEAVRYSTAAIRFGGIKVKYILLLIKSIIGRKVIKTIR